jgi:hypothetical protein
MRFQVAAIAFVAGLVAAAPVAQQDVDTILKALAQNSWVFESLIDLANTKLAFRSPEDANIARGGLTKRADDVDSILKALEKNS